MINFRDFGYKNVKKGLLFRSASLNDLSIDDQNVLIENNIKTIVDLRGLDEREAKPDTKINGIDNLSIPLSVIGDAKPIVYKGLKLPDLIDCYHQLVAMELKETWGKIFDLLINSEGGVLFHCSQGKDRTGVVVAMILTTLGVDKETIFKDYLLTNEKPVFFGNQDMPKEVQEILADYFSAKKEYLEASFEYIDKTYGSFNEFLKKVCSLDENKLIKLKEKYLL